MKNTIFAILLVPFLLACGSDVVSYSAPVGITFKLQSKDADPTTGAFLLSKNIAQPSGNPFGAFVNDAQRALGHPPSHIAATYATLQLLPTSTLNTTPQDMGNVFAASAVGVGFVLTSSMPVPVCNVMSPTGTAVGMVTTFDSSGLSAADYSDLLGASFAVDMAGNATTSFANASPAESADVQVTIGFVAYK